MAYLRKSESLTNKKKGNIGENVASTFLVKHGFTILIRNYRKAWGEIDIICQKDGILHFFEVKSITGYSGPDNGHQPEENVDALKTRHIGRMVETYLYETGNADREFHFHVLCVYLNMPKRVARVKWIRDIIL